MVTLKTAEFDFIQRDGGILPPEAPGLGITVNEDLLGSPAAVWGD
jgi:L-alanine-DL-glutamate epimerase-like enolase superfamily enzyme